MATPYDLPFPPTDFVLSTLRRTTDIESKVSELGTTSSPGKRILLLDFLSFAFQYPDPSRSEQYARDILSLARRSRNAFWKARAHRRLAFTSFMRGSGADAMSSCDTALHFLKTAPTGPPTQHECSTTHYLKGIIHSQFIGNIPAALDEFSKAIACQNGLGDDTALAFILAAMGETYANAGMFSDAIDVLTFALDVFERTERSGDVLRTSGTIATALFATGNYEAGLDILHKAENPDIPFMYVVDIYRLLGMGYRDAKDFGKAATYHTKYLDHYREIGDTFREGCGNMDIGRVDVAAGRFTAALDRFVTAERLFLDVGHNGALGDVYKDIALVHMEIGDIKTAMSFLGKSLPLAEETNMLHLQLVVHENIARICERNGRIAESLRHYKRYMEIEHGILSERVRYRIMAQQHRSQIESLRRMHRIERQEQARQLAELSLQVRTYEGILKKVQDQTDHDTAFGPLVEDIQRQIQHTTGWVAFDRQLQTLDQDFIRRLMERNPSFTPAEIRICSLLRLNMSNKEIADVLSLSSRTIDAHRASIRKKLCLQPYDSIVTCLTMI